MTRKFKDAAEREAAITSGSLTPVEGVDVDTPRWPDLIQKIEFVRTGGERSVIVGTLREDDGTVHTFELPDEPRAKSHLRNMHRDAHAKRVKR